MKKHFSTYVKTLIAVMAASVMIGCGGGDDDDDDGGDGGAAGQGPAPASLAGFNLRVEDAGEVPRDLVFGADNSFQEKTLMGQLISAGTYTYQKTGAQTAQATVTTAEGTSVIDITFSSPTQGSYTGSFTPADGAAAESFSGNIIHATAPSESGGGGNGTAGGGTPGAGSDPGEPSNGDGGVVAPASLAGKTIAAQMTSGALAGSTAVINFTANGFDAASSEGSSAGTYEYRASANSAVLVLLFAGESAADRVEAQLTFTSATSGTVTHTQFSSDGPPQISEGTFTLQ